MDVLIVTPCLGIIRFCSCKFNFISSRPLNVVRDQCEDNFSLRFRKCRQGGFSLGLQVNVLKDVLIYLNEEHFVPDFFLFFPLAESLLLLMHIKPLYMGRKSFCFMSLLYHDETPFKRPLFNNR